MNSIQAMQNPGLVIFYLIIFLFFYFIPSMLASSLDNKNTHAIFVLNLFLGWTFIGWVLALVWAFVGKE